ncbi:MAG TPA: L-rhamnose isomerase [Bacillota bacterium]|nr:L-rhamnose isomerase [Bacillota bacterium]
MNFTEKQINTSYQEAREIYAANGVDTEAVLQQLSGVPISLQCWQGDDVGGFEVKDGPLSGGGIMATGNYPGKARNGDELRQDLDQALQLIPGKTRVNLHAIYAETGSQTVGRDELEIWHFQNWVDWAAAQAIGLDFNPTLFAHPLAESGFTLSNKVESIRRFWVEHVKRSREIAAAMGAALDSPAVNNLWIPDGSKDFPIDRQGPRNRLKQSLDEIYSRAFPGGNLIDSVESKLFGIGSEAYVVGSHDFYLGYAAQNQKVLCLDMGHFHPTESIADKISALLAFLPQLLIHVSRGMRWDSDHVAILNDDLLALVQEIRRCEAWERVFFALDFFDASINRLIAWVTGARALRKALLIALLEPTAQLRQEEEAGDYGRRLALLEEFKGLPWGAVWNQYCLRCNVPPGGQWLTKVREYEVNVLAKR